MQSRLILFAASAGIAALTIYLLISGRNILIPIAIAVMAWYLINAIARGIRKHQHTRRAPAALGRAHAHGAGRHRGGDGRWPRW